MHETLTILSLIACVVAASFDDDIFAGNDPKDNYFRYVRTYSQADYDDSLRATGEEAPKPYGFDIYYPKHSKRALRLRRDDNVMQKEEVDDSIDSSSGIIFQSVPIADDKLLDIDDALKPLELDVLEADVENSTELLPTADVVKNDLVINDFIRFKRDLQKAGPEAVETIENDAVRSKREPERSGKMLLSESQPVDTNREPRGPVQEKWLKQPYPVQNDNRDRDGRNFDDSHNGEPPNAPRVHFVTQRRSESAPPLVYHSYEGREREGRSRDLTRQRDIDLERDFEPTYYPRSTRHYSSQVGGGRDFGSRDSQGSHSGTLAPRRPDAFYRNYERDSRDRDFRDDRDLRDRDYNRDYDRDRDSRDRRFYGQDRYHEEDRPIPSIAKQKRIIYYATLPDIVRPPGGSGGSGGPIAGDRDRDRDMDRERERSFRRGYHDDRDRDRDNRVHSDDRDRYAPAPVSGGSGAINYRFRNDSPYDNRDAAGDREKSRYDEAATSKGNSYPTKVSSADVSVRALKKNPERRIYSEVGRRYNHDDGPATYQSNHR